MAATGRRDLELGTILLGEGDLGLLRDRARNAEELGFDHVGVGDVPMHYRELYVALGVAAQATGRCQIGPMVTNPVSRHPGVTAAAASSLDALTGGRYVLGLGAGGGPLFSLGLEVPRLAEIRLAVTTIRRLLAGEPSPWEDKPLSFTPVHEVRVYLAAYGLRTAELAGEVADGIIFAGGVSGEVLRSARRAVDAGARRAGRSSDEVDFWVMTRAAVASRRTDAIDSIRANLASAGSHGLRSEAQLATVPDEMREAVRELQGRYQQSEHVKWDGANARLIDELGITDFLADRFAIAGTPQDVETRLDDLATAGVSRVIVPAVDRDPDAFMEDFARAARGTETRDEVGA